MEQFEPQEYILKRYALSLNNAQKIRRYMRDSGYSAVQEQHILEALSELVEQPARERKR